MANKILIRRSTSQGAVPTTAQLDLAELAINTYDGRLFAKKNDGLETIVDLTENDTITLVGDASGSGKTSINVALATTGVTSGSYGTKVGSNVSIPVIDVDTKGRITNASELTFDLLGDFGNIAGQNIDNITIIGGTIDGTVIGGSDPTSATFTDVNTQDLTVNGDAVVVGNLTVQGTVTSVDSTTVAIGDLNIELAKGSTVKEQSDGGGISVNLGANGYATFNYLSSDDSWNVNKLFKSSFGGTFAGQVNAASFNTTGALNAGQSTLGATTASSLDATPIGATTPSTAKFTTLQAASGNITGALVVDTISTNSTANVGGALNVTGITTLTAALKVNSTSTFTQNVYTTGAAVIAGDESIAGKLQVQGAIYKGGYEVLNTADTIDGGTY